MIWLTLIAFFLLVISWVTKKLHQTLGVLTLLCLLFGIFLGYFHQVPPLKVMQVISEVTLVLFLFIDGVRLHFPKIIHFHREAFRQMTMGFFLQALLGTVLAHFFLSLPWLSSCLLGLALSAIDLKVTPTLFAAETIPSRIRQVLHLESSATPLFTVFLFALFQAKCPMAVLLPLPLGFIVGVIVAYVAQIALKSRFASRSFLISSLFVAPLALYYLCSCFRMSGWIAVIAFALTLGHLARNLCDGLFDLGRRQGKLLFFLFIITFGCQILGSLAYSLTWQMILYAALSLFVIRFLGIFISFLGCGFQWRTIFFCSFFGPRALVPVALALLAVPYNLPVYTTLYGAVLISLLVHTLFGFSISYWYGHAMDYPTAAESLPTVRFPEG